MAQNSPQKPLGLSDVFAGAVLFVLCVLGLQALLGSFVPGLLKPDTTVHIIISGLMFILAWGFLGNYLFQPYLDLFEEREARTEGDKLKAADIRKDGVALRSEIEEALRKVRLEGIKLRDGLVDEAKRSVNDIVTAAQTTSESDFGRAQLKIADLREQALAEVSAESEKLAEQLVQKALASGPNQTIH